MSIQAQEIIDEIKTRGRGDPPSALADIFVGPLERVLLFLDGKIDFATALQTIDSVILLLESDEAIAELAGFMNTTTGLLTAQLKTGLENHGSNFGITRRAAAASTGSVLLTRSTDLVVPPDTPITVPTGRRFIAPSLDQDYRTTNSTIIDSMSFDADLNKFVFSVPVESVNVGLTTVAAEGQISQLRDPITGIEGVTNANPTSGGRDEETDRELADRIKDALSANNIGTITGYRNMIFLVAGVQDIKIVGAGDPFMLRDSGDGGSVDAYITDPVPFSISEVATAANVTPVGGKFDFAPSRQPLIDDVSAVKPTGFGPDIVKDLGAFAGSTRAKDVIKFDSDPTGETIEYQVNNLVKTVEDFINEEERNQVGSDVLVKEATFIPIDVIVTIHVLPEFESSRAIVRANVESAVTQFISSLGIGDTLEQSDVVNVIVNVSGVDRVELPPTKFERSTGTGQADPIFALANEVLRPGSIIVNF